MGCKSNKSIMVGNKFSEDIMGAINAGMPAILVNSKLTKSEKAFIKKEEIELDVLSNIGELKDIL